LASGLAAVTASGAAAVGMKICVPAKEGAAVVTPKAGACEVGFTKTTVLAEPEQEKLEQILPFINFVKEGIDKKPTIQFFKVNLQIVNGLGKTNSFNGMGNLIIGYDEGGASSPSGAGREQTGSHNLVLGEEQTYTKYASILGGSFNVASAPFSVVFGRENLVTANYTSVTGGNVNKATGEYASVSGGREDEASGRISSVAGGSQNTASGRASSVTSGETNRALGEYSSVSGGQENEAEGIRSSITSGKQNHASGAQASVTGGSNSLAAGENSTVSGGLNNVAHGEWSWIAGGAHNQTGSFASFSVILGKELQETTSPFEVKD
jgi:hypothetical protein